MILLAQKNLERLYVVNTVDFSKAFDKVDHQILLTKLHAYGIRGKLFEWFKSYLSNRDQTVVVNGSHSYLSL